MVVNVLKEFTDVMPLELLKTPPLRKSMDYCIELELGVKPPTIPLYCMSLLLLVELR